MDQLDNSPSIEIEGLTKRFGSVVALDNLSFSVRSGELFFLLGPSGCGKSTLLRVLAGLETPDAGRVRFAGRDILDQPPHKRGAPMVFQNYALWPHLTVHDNVAFGLVERGIAKKEIGARVEEALEQVELKGLGKRKPGQLSGGQQQRVALARALVVRPEIILLDEPLSNLDAKLRIEMRREIERIHERTSVTLIYVTHDQSEALGLADRMAVMEAGRIQAIGAPHELYHSPPNRFCAEFLGDANIFEGQYLGREREGDWVLVDCPFGIWRGRGRWGASAEPEKGSAVCIMVRPEHLRPGTPPAVGSSGQSTWNGLEATTGKVRMNGSTVSVQLEAKGLSLTAAILSEGRSSVHSQDSAPWFVSADDTIILAESSDRASGGEVNHKGAVS